MKANVPTKTSAAASTQRSLRPRSAQAEHASGARRARRDQQEEGGL